MSQWYLSPRQHVVEAALSIFVLVPLIYIFGRACRARVRFQRARRALDLRKPTWLMKGWAAALMGLVSVGAFFKFSKDELISHPAYLWQPCHVLSLVVGVCSFVQTEWSLLIFHAATTLWWGPFLAFIAPELPANPIEIVIFWMQHALLLLVPIFRLTVGGRWMYRDFWWNAVGFLFLTCYHWWLIAPVNIITGVNVATMSVPPASLAMLGKYYRVVWGVSCILLQVMSVSVMSLFAYLSGQWPTDETAVPSARLSNKGGRDRSHGSAGGRETSLKDASGVAPTEALQGPNR